MLWLRSFVNENTDTWVVDDAEEQDFLRERCREGMQWTRLMDLLMQRAHAKGKTKAEFEALLRRIPVFPEHVEACRAIR